MKELSIEEKAKAYDNALKVLHKYDGAHIMFTQDLKEEMFPELREVSEDERIRKALIKYYSFDRDGGSHALDNITPEQILDWLERQGEPTEINPSEFDLQLNRLLKQFDSLPKEELVGGLRFYLNVVQNDGTYKKEKQGKHKPSTIKFDEPDIEEMVKEYKKVLRREILGVPYNSPYLDANSQVYRQGLIDMYNKVKG